MIICFEGAPAVGKSTLAKNIAENGVHLIIPEVNMLFGKENKTSNEWYCERQVERWSIATARNIDNKPVIMDGDIFQPIWFKWGYPDRIAGDFSEIVEFYRERINKEEIQFPDAYVLFYVNEVERERREFGRSSVQGRTAEQAHAKINSYKDLAEYQRQYFEYLERLAPGLVTKVDNTCVEASIEKVLSIRNAVKLNTSEVFEASVDWCLRN